MSKSTLCGKMVSKDEVFSIQTPEETNYWKPLDHGDFISMVEESILKNGFGIDRERFVLDHNRKKGVYGDRLFALYDITGDFGNDDGVLSIGAINAHDKTISARIMGGDKVFICSNLMFMSQFELRKKHNGEMEGFSLLVDNAISEIEKLYIDEVSYHEHWKNEYISDEGAAHTLMRLFENEHLIASKVGEVWNNFVHPVHDVFATGEHGKNNVWNLYNAYSEHAKERQGRNMITASQECLGVNEFFREEFPVSAVA